MPDEPVVEIRRYPNRRYYDRSRAQYVTLQDIEDLVQSGKTVEIRDSKTGDDLTRQVLTQILMERHPRKMDLFPVALLHSLLRANDVAINLWQGYLRQSLAATQAWQPSNQPFATPVDWVSAFLTNFGPQTAPAVEPEPEPEPPPAPPPPPDAGRDELARRLDELAARLAELEAARLDNDGAPKRGRRR